MTIELQPEFPHRTRKKDRFPLAGSRSQRGPAARARREREARVPYIELHAHSSYSFLDGASLPEELAVQAAELGYPALALTDHDGVYGSLEFAHAAKYFGVRPITGAEVTLADHSHVTLLVETQQGYSNLSRLLTAAHGGTRLPGRESDSPLPPSLDLELLLEHREGLVCLSGCARHGLPLPGPDNPA